jgi:hypothetical protein
VARGSGWRSRPALVGRAALDRAPSVSVTPPPWGVLGRRIRELPRALREFQPA